MDAAILLLDLAYVSRQSILSPGDILIQHACVIFISFHAYSKILYSELLLDKPTSVNVIIVLAYICFATL